MAITDFIGQAAPIVGTIGGGIVGTILGGPTGAVVGAQLGGSLGSVVSAGIEAKKPINIMGATGAEKSSAMALKEMADDLRMQGGLSETEYSRMVEQINSATNTETSNIISLSRENKMSPLVLDKMVKDKLRNIAASKQKNIESLTAMDIEESRKQLSQAAAVMGTANVAATNIGNIERAKEEKIAAAKELKIQNLIKSVSGVVSSSMAAYGTYSKGQAELKNKIGDVEVVDQNIDKPIIATKNIDYTEIDKQYIDIENKPLYTDEERKQIEQENFVMEEFSKRNIIEKYKIKDKYPLGYEIDWQSAWD